MGMEPTTDNRRNNGKKHGSLGIGSKWDSRSDERKIRIGKVQLKCCVCGDVLARWCKKAAVKYTKAWCAGCADD